MKKTIIRLDEIKLVGITARTNNELEANPESAKIGMMMQKYFSKKVSTQIQHKKNLGNIYSCYTDYQSDFTGDYTYFIGEEVTSFENIIDPDLRTLTISGQDYVKFTSEPGPMPEVVINMWKEIWKMKDSDLGGTRSYIADFEIYDERSLNPQNAVLDIYIGIK